MTKELERLVHAARGASMSSHDREKQRRSFAYGNTAFENSDITREMVDREANRLASQKRLEKKDEQG